MAHTHKQTERYHTANGSTTTFAFPFEYYQKSDVHVTVNGTPKTQGTHYDVNTGGTDVVFKTSPSDHTPANNDVVRIYRDTDVNTSKATFAAGSSIRATDLNNNETQLLFSAQEAVEQEIVTADIRDGQITSAKIKDGAVTADQIGANALTYAKIQNVSATNRILGRDTSGAGIIEEITPANLRTMINVEDGSTGDQTNAEIRAAVEAAGDSNVFTDADHTKLDGIAAGAEVNVQSDWNSTSGDNFILNKPTVPAAQVQSDWDASSGMGEILNKPTILELIDEDNFSTNSATKPPSQQSTKAYITSTSQPLDAQLTTLGGASSGTASIIGDSSKTLAADIDELNLLDGKSVVTSVSGSSTDVQLPTAKAVNDQILAVTNALGGFVAIANETSFPTTNPDPSNGAGTVVSIGDAGGVVVNGSGTATITNGAGSGNTVTITGFPSSVHSTTLADNLGLQVQTTTTLHTYTYHKLLSKEADALNASTAVSDFNDRYRVASSEPNSSLDNGDLWFNTTSGNEAMKVYNSTTSAWEEITSTGNYDLCELKDTDGSAPTIDGSVKDFKLVTKGTSNAVTPNHAAQLIVSLNGIIQEPNTGTSTPTNGFAVTGTTIKFSNNLESGTTVFIAKIGATVDIGTPSTNTVTNAILQSGCVDNSKVATNAAIAKSKLAALDIVNADVNASAAIAKSKLAALDIVNADINASAAIATSKISGLAASATTDTTNAANIGSGTLPAARIGDDSIVEGKLDIHQDPTDGKFLKFTSSNGMEWGDVPAGVGGAAGVDFNDNVKIRSGTGNDLEIYHDGSNSYIKEVGTGDLLVTTNGGQIQLQKGDTEVLANFGIDGACNLFYDNAKKIETTATGVTVTGTVAATAYTGDGSSLTGVAAASANGTMYKNTLSITDAHTIAATEGAHSVGPISVGNTVTVSGRWVIS